MSYEVVDPAGRDERGVFYGTLTEAMVAASPTLEVWQIADDEPRTRMVMCWPDPEFQGDAPFRGSLRVTSAWGVGPKAVSSHWVPAAAKAARRWHLEVTNEEATAQFVREHIGRAEREATAILADHDPVTPQQVHALVALAWGRGFIAGFGKGTETFGDMLERITEGGAS